MKIFVTDIDGTTLFDGSNNLPENSKLAYSRILKDKNNKLIVASGRTPRNIYTIFKNNDDITYIGENGNIVLNKGEIIYINKFKKEDALKILDFVHSDLDNYILVSTTYACFFFKPSGNIRVDDEKDYRYRDVDFNYFKNEILKDLDIVKISIYRKKMDDIFYSFYKKAKENFSFAEVFDANNSRIDISPTGGNKGNALQFVFNKFNYNYEDAYIFGDGENDISMLKLTKHSYCPSRALASVKNIANSIYTNFDETVSSILCDEE